MGDIRLFNTTGGAASEIPGSNVALERQLQTLMENNLEAFLGVRFLASELTTSNGGRIDTLGIDENGAPVIIEYKRSRNENVINQGLFYLDWLMDHKGEFTLLAMEQYGTAVKDTIDWSAPRIVCIAGDFTKYDGYAVQQMGRNIDLVRYIRYGEGLLLLELVGGASGSKLDSQGLAASGSSKKQVLKTVADYLSDADEALTNLFNDLEARLIALGDDVQRKELKHYFAYRRLKNFACVEVKAASQRLQVYLKVNPDSVDLVDGFSRDVRDIGHFGTGDLEVNICNLADLDRAQPLLEISYADS